MPFINTNHIRSVSNPRPSSLLLSLLHWLRGYSSSNRSFHIEKKKRNKTLPVLIHLSFIDIYIYIFNFIISFFGCFSSDVLYVVMLRFNLLPLFQDAYWLGTKTRSRDATLSRQDEVDMSMLRLTQRLSINHGGEVWKGTFRDSETVAKILRLRKCTVRHVRPQYNVILNSNLNKRR